ncbi:helix-turn-helix domain-containing protein [Clostridium beijerinckii]|uniref:Helix-turn-helix transcriptional regulator n=1 Tax=Clostridium beijerinckii TaxID=1520 RepID=A0A7X9SMF0_CLOBE|nr:helix-turn-helix transcriptional regulator [Clostridium beijerinckii]NMF04597.1 helix-turn-helix transcriptional regulator [Clostridium beijerinckii]
MLRKRRNDIGLSLRKLSKISGISKTYLISMEKYPNRCNPTFEIIFKLEKSLLVEHGTVYLYFADLRKDIIINTELKDDIIE